MQVASPISDVDNSRWRPTPVDAQTLDHDPPEIKWLQLAGDVDDHRLVASGTNEPSRAAMSVPNDRSSILNTVHGCGVRVPGAARFYHHGSMTIRLDPAGRASRAASVRGQRAALPREMGADGDAGDA